MLGAAIPKSLTLLAPHEKDENLAVIAAVGGVVIMTSTPLAGRLSDRTMSRWGMRKPWIAGGLAVGIAGVAVLAFAPDVAWLAVGWAVTQLGFGTVQMAQYVLLADQVPARIRARVSGAVGIASGCATAASVVIVAALPVDQRWSWFVVPGAIGVVLAALLLLGYRDAVRMEPPPSLTPREVLGTYWLSPIRHRDFAWAWASRFFMTMSVLTVSLYVFFLIVDELGYSAAEAGAVQASAVGLFLVGNIASAAVFGWLSDCIGRRKPIIWLSGLLSAVGIGIMMVTGDLGGFIAGITVAGIAQGAYIAVDVALMTEVLPYAADAGKDLGIVALSYQLPQILGPLAVTACIALSGGYVGLYVFAIVCSVLGGIAVIPIRGVR